jgi:hypothetical protein
VGQFFICLDNQHNVARCVRSRDEREVVTVAGVPFGGGVVRLFAGIVDTVDHDPTRGYSRQWLITMREADRTSWPQADDLKKIDPPQ